MVNPTPIELNPYLKARGESQLRAKQAFERGASWRYGFIFGVLLLSAGYALDALQQFQAHSHYWWLNFALASVTLAPLALCAGGIAGYVNWALKLAVWAGFGVAIAWSAERLPFETTQFALQWLDPNLRGVDYASVLQRVGDSFGLLAALSAFIGVGAGLTQTFAVGWAWERSTPDFKFTAGSWTMLFASLPFALAFGLILDGFTAQPLRAELQTVNAIIQSGLNDAPNLETREFTAPRAFAYAVGQRWRNQFAPDYALYLAARNQTETYIDAAFANGNLLRCRTAALGELPGGCVDLKQTYGNYISEFLRHGAFECQDCASEISAQARAWQQTNARTLTAADTTRVLHGAGSVVTVRVSVADGKLLECRFWGVNPIRLTACQ